MGFLVVGWGSLKKSLAYGGGFQAAYMVGGMAGVYQYAIRAGVSGWNLCQICKQWSVGGSPTDCTSWRWAVAAPF